MQHRWAAAAAIAVLWRTVLGLLVQLRFVHDCYAAQASCTSRDGPLL
jgi:hypothetical protein